MGIMLFVIILLLCFVIIELAVIDKRLYKFFKDK